MYSGRQPAITPLTATLQTVAARLSGSSTPSTSSGSRSVWRRNSSIALARRRHDRQAVAPFVLDEVAVDLLEAAAEHDVARAGFVGPRLAGGDGTGEVVDDLGQRDVEDVVAQLLGGLHAGMARAAARTGRLGMPSPTRVARGLAEESLADER